MTNDAPALAFNTTVSELAAAVRQLRDGQDGLKTAINGLAIKVEALPNRAELAERLDVGTYQVAHEALRDDVKAVAADLAHLEQKLEDSPQRLLGWLGLGIGCMSMIGTAVVALAGVSTVVVMLMR